MNHIVYVSGEYGGTRTFEIARNSRLASFDTSDHVGSAMFESAIDRLAEEGCAIYDSTHGHAIYTPAWAAHMFLPAQPQPDAAMAVEVARA